MIVMRAHSWLAGRRRAAVRIEEWKEQGGVWNGRQEVPVNDFLVKFVRVSRKGL